MTIGRNQLGLGGAILLFLAVSGCGTDPNSEDTVRLRLAHVYEVSAPTHECGAAVLEERVEAADVGLEIDVFPAAQLGDEEELLEQLVSRQLEMAIAGPSFLAAWHEPIGGFDAAYAFKDTDHLMEVANGEIGNRLWDQLREEHGMRVLDTWFYGERHITSNEPIRHPDDLEGFRLRMPNARVWLATGEALGASPTPIAFAEVYVALQQGIVDGQENPVPTIQAMGFHEVQRYVNFTRHIQSSTQLLVAEPTWQRLTPEQQTVLQEAAEAARDEVRQCIESGEDRILQQWEKQGAMEPVEDVDLDAFRERAREFFREGFVFSPLYREIAGIDSDDAASK